MILHSDMLAIWLNVDLEENISYQGEKYVDSVDFTTQIKLVNLIES